MKKLLALLLTLCLVIGMVPLAASAEGEEETGEPETSPKTIYVDATNGDDSNDGSNGNAVKTLTKALEKATHGDTINLAAGEYTGPEDRYAGAVVSLTGTDGTVIKGGLWMGGTGDASDESNLISVSSITVKDITFQNTEEGWSNSGLGFSHIKGATITVEDCTFTGFNHGVHMNTGSGTTLTVSNSKFSDVFIAMSAQADTGTLVIGDGNQIKDATFAAQVFGGDKNYHYTTEEAYDKAFNAEGEETGMDRFDNSGLDASEYTTGVNTVVKTAEELKNAIENKTEANIYLGDDFTLENPINITTGAKITINGNGNTITFAGTGKCKTVFTAPSGTEVEGIPANVTLTVNNVNFKGQGTYSGYAAIVGGNAEDTKVTFTECKFEGLHCGVYVNQQNKDSKPTVTITGSTFEKTKYVTSVDTVTPGVDPSATTVVTENNTLGEGTQEQEVFENIILKKDGSQTVYNDFQQALTDATAGDTILLNKDVELSSKLTIDKAITIEGNGESTIKLTGEVSTGAFIEISGDNANNVTLKNLTVDTNNNAKHGIQFYSVKGGTLENVTVKGGYWTSVIVNGSTGITIKGCKLNPTASGEKKPYAHIEYAMGSGVTTIPSITVDDNTYGTANVTQIWADKDTTANVKTAMGGTPTEDEIRQEVMDSITNTGATDVTVAIAVDTNNPEDVETGTSEGEKKPDPEPTDPPVVYPTTYKTTVEECEGGSVVASPSSAREGQKVTLTVKPQAGQELKSLKVTDKDGDAVTLTKVEGGYTFNMPKGGVTVTAVFGCDGGAACPSKGFTDVDSEKWYHEYMDYAVEKGLLEGTSPTTMEPNATLTRAQLAQILYNLEGKPQVQGDLDFTDVAEGKWYYAAILWANQEGVVDGMSPDTFAPNEDISRQDLALMLYRYAGEPTVTGDLDGFKDAGQVGDWAEEAITWAVEEGIIDGMTPTTLEPTGTATRAQAAAMLQRFLEG